MKGLPTRSFQVPAAGVIQKENENHIEVPGGRPFGGGGSYRNQQVVPISGNASGLSYPQENLNWEKCYSPISNPATSTSRADNRGEDHLFPLNFRGIFALCIHECM